MRAIAKLLAVTGAGLLLTGCQIPTNTTAAPAAASTAPSAATAPANGTALAALDRLPVKGRAPMSGYSRTQFGGVWAPDGHSCDTRNDVLRRDMTAVTYRHGACLVAAATLAEPYTGTTEHFTRGAATSALIQIDHVAAIGDLWQTGAQQLTHAQRVAIYNDPLELLAVDGKQNDLKGDSDAASWLPPNKAFRCRYVALQVAVKAKYGLWVTAAERTAIATVLRGCPGETLPTEPGGRQ